MILIDANGFGTVNCPVPVLPALMSSAGELFNVWTSARFSSWFPLFEDNASGAHRPRRSHQVLQKLRGGTAPLPTTALAVSGIVHPMSMSDETPKITKAQKH